MMKITVEHYDSKYTFEVPDGLDIYDIARELRKIVFCLGYQYDNVCEILPNDY